MPVSRRKALIDKPGERDMFREGYRNSKSPLQCAGDSLRRFVMQIRRVQWCPAAGSLAQKRHVGTCRQSTSCMADQDPRSALASEDAANVDHGP